MSSNKQKRTGSAEVRRLRILGLSAILAVVTVAFTATAVAVELGFSASLLRTATSISLVALALLSGIIACACATRYYRQTIKEATDSEQSLRERSTLPDPNRSIAAADALLGKLSVAGVMFFAELVGDPQRHIERITEHVQPRTRVLSVRSTLSVAMPPFDDDERILLPVYRRQKYTLAQSLKFFNGSGERLSSVRHEIAIAYALACLRVLIEGEAPGALSAYKTHVEPEIARAFIAPTNSNEVRHIVTVRDGEASIRAQFISRIVATIRQIAGDDYKPTHSMQTFFALVVEFSLNHLTCVQTTIPKRSKQLLPVPEIMRFTVESFAAPAVVDHKVGEPGTKVGLTENLIGTVRKFFDESISTVYFRPLSADHARSYHLEISGPESSFLGKQSILSDASSTPADLDQVAYTMSKRRGQRSSHLYVSDGEGFALRVMEAQFFERLPGSVGAATWSAWACFATIALASLAVGTAPSSSDAGDPNVDILAVLFAFPIAVAAWAGHDQPRNVFTHSLVALASRGASVVLTTCAAFLYIGSTASIDVMPLWAVLSGASLLLAVAMTTSWRLRWRIHHEFITKKPEESIIK